VNRVLEVIMIQKVVKKANLGDFSEITSEICSHYSTLTAVAIYHAEPREMLRFTILEEKNLFGINGR
jgi:hypothetical protein